MPPRADGKQRDRVRGAPVEVEPGEGFMANGEPRVVGPGFHERVYAVVKLVPRGFVTTYGDVGTMLGSPRVARQVGWALANLDLRQFPDVPWHRVVNAQGTVSFRGDVTRADLQETLLRAEGIAVDQDGRLDLKSHRYSYPGIPIPFDLASH